MVDMKAEKKRRRDEHNARNPNPAFLLPSLHCLPYEESHRCLGPLQVQQLLYCVGANMNLLPYSHLSKVLTECLM